MDTKLITNSLPTLVQPMLKPDDSDPLIASAVLLILHKIDNQWHLLLTKRSEHLNSHAGQISFPGGRYEKEDLHLKETAIRETEEEIGLARKYFHVFSQLDDHPTLTGYRIYPYIAVTETLPELVIDTGEVAEVFHVPLAFLFDKKNQQLESANYQNKNYDYYKIIWQDKYIWGATARMIVNLAHYFKE